MELSPQVAKKISKVDDEIAGYFHANLANNHQLSQPVEKQSIQIKKQSAKIEKLEKYVNELERQFGQNSNNSSKPSSSDRFRKPTNLRQSGLGAHPNRGN
ncbi:DUF6444 domain-containing protein [Paenibacillus oryzisoli]|uniref:DUF6444 domain-containing protein n=1 Tax=Paenibacillus oryzisoli TaxID=1850517 RepID=A0A197ZWU3_9BACL|nr:DUF6444 domain-containing protein [Paenibacillus oryzisoli]OAS13286.1 hypothetical protein A8708_10845 [Paenibacillus oryzisoli]